MKGAAIRFSGELNEAAMAGSGFLFNLVYSAYMLWNENYNNFSWERVTDLSINHMPRILQLLGGRKLPSLAGGEKDIYPARLFSDVEGCGTRQGSEIGCGKTRAIANIGEKGRQPYIQTHP